jgi:hypothetical protein
MNPPRSGGEPFGDRELAMVSAALYLTLVLAGSGRFSLDRIAEQRN